MHFIKNLQCFNRDDNLAVVPPIYKNWVSLYSPSHEEFKYLIVVSIFYCIGSLQAFVHMLSKLPFLKHLKLFYCVFL